MSNWKLGDPHRHNSNPNMLEGLPSLAEFLGKSEQTAKRWIMRDGLPATKMPNGKWLTHKGLVMQWIYAGHQAILKNQAAYALEESELIELAIKMNVDPSEVTDRMKKDVEQERDDSQRRAST